MPVTRDQVNPNIEWDPIFAAIADTPREYEVMIEQAGDDEFEEAMARQEQRRTAFVYVAQAGENGPIKIGLAHDIPRRICALQIGNPEPLRLLVSVDGGRAVERKLHRDAKPYKLRGEWFRPEPGMLALIESLRIARPARRSARL